MNSATSTTTTDPPSTSQACYPCRLLHFGQMGRTRGASVRIRIDNEIFGRWYSAAGGPAPISTPHCVRIRPIRRRPTHRALAGIVLAPPRSAAGGHRCSLHRHAHPACRRPRGANVGHTRRSPDPGPDPAGRVARARRHHRGTHRTQRRALGRGAGRTRPADRRRHHGRDLPRPGPAR
jgi:hypothetical protein